MCGYYGGWAPYVPVAKRRQQATKQVAKMKKNGMTILPVVIDGLKIAKTFWGKAWCDHLNPAAILKIACQEEEHTYVMAPLFILILAKA
jgi:hypothetical protein